MARDFTDDDRDKDVFTSAGDRVGTIGDTRGDSATVRRDGSDDDGVFESVKEMLGWSDDEDEHELRSEDVDRYENDGVYLRKRE
jgi:hypothetical protein